MKIWVWHGVGSTQKVSVEDAPVPGYRDRWVIDLRIEGLFVTLTRDDGTEERRTLREFGSPGDNRHWFGCGADSLTLSVHNILLGYDDDRYRPRPKVEVVKETWKTLRTLD